MAMHVQPLFTSIINYTLRVLKKQHDEATRSHAVGHVGELVRVDVGEVLEGDVLHRELPCSTMM